MTASVIVTIPPVVLILAGGFIDRSAPPAYLTLGNVLIGAGLTLGATPVTECGDEDANATI